MKINLTYALVGLILSAFLAVSCHKNNDCTDNKAGHALTGLWEGEATTTLYSGDSLVLEDKNKAFVEFNSDYTGLTRTVVTFLEQPVDTVFEAFEYAYVPEARLLDLSILDTGTLQNPENSDFSRVFDILRLEENELEALHEKKGITIDGQSREFSIHWQLERQ